MNMKEQAEKIQKNLAQINNEIEKLIADECGKRNIGAIIFENARMMDKTHAVVDDAYNDEGVSYLRVLGFKIDGDSFFLMTEEDYYNLAEIPEDELTDELNDYVFLTPEHAEKLDKFFATPIEDVLDVTSCLSELLYSFQEVIRDFEELGYARLPQSISYKEIDTGE